jgi:hypothetical protein
LPFTPSPLIPEGKVRTRVAFRFEQDLRWYAQQNSGFFPPDIQKLVAYPAPHRYLLVFAYPRCPKASEWHDVVNELSRRIPEAAVSIARIHDSKDNKISIGWLEVRKTSEVATERALAASPS